MGFIEYQVPLYSNAMPAPTRVLLAELILQLAQIVKRMLFSKLIILVYAMLDFIRIAVLVSVNHAIQVANTVIIPMQVISVKVVTLTLS